MVTTYYHNNEISKLMSNEYENIYSTLTSSPTSKSWKSIIDIFKHSPVFRHTSALYNCHEYIYIYLCVFTFQAQYRQHDGCYKYVRKLMALCHLPHEHMVDAFNKLKKQASDDTPRIHELLNYINTTWLTSSVWPLTSLSVFMRPTRTLLFLVYLNLQG